MLSAHYRSPLNFSKELMEASKNGLERIMNAAEHLRDLLAGAQGEELTAEEKAGLGEAGSFAEKFDAAMDDDFNTADAISAVFELVRFANANVTQQSTKAYVEAVYRELLELADILGLILEKEKEILAEDVEKLIEERQAARKAKDFARADEIRDMLLAQGIILEDTREGVKWKKA